MDIEATVTSPTDKELKLRAKWLLVFGLAASDRSNCAWFNDYSAQALARASV
jgi:hypothetical protein